MSSNLYKSIYLYYLVLSTQFVFSKSQPCPNSCNGHGLCQTAKRTCECYDGFHGADCSLYTCPYGIAWWDKAIESDKAHQPALCSNMGICDTGTGVCVCRPGFEGVACERMTCPGLCNGKGKCLSLKLYANTREPGLGVFKDGSFKVTPLYNYSTNWDAEKIYGSSFTLSLRCIARPLSCLRSRTDLVTYYSFVSSLSPTGCQCDGGFYGPDCTLQSCPTGDDPLTGVGVPSPTNPSQFNDIQSVVCKATDGKFTLTFRGHTTIPINWYAQASEIVAALQGLSTVHGVSVALYGSQACTDTGSSFSVEFKQEFGKLPIMLVDASKLVHSTSTATVTVTKQQDGTKENLPCSGRGICDSSTSTCTCSVNYGTSNGYNLPGTRGDCGYTLATIQGCPGGVSCSAHGFCSGSPTFTCSCNDGWEGADCSEKSCPKGTSWFTYPSGENVAHLYEYNDCSDMGVCDHAAGTCACVNGFTGASCNRIMCPGDPNVCSGHGSCADMMTLAAAATVNGVNGRFTYGLSLIHI